VVPYTVVVVVVVVGEHTGFAPPHVGACSISEERERAKSNGHYLSAE
jgi:hypothetical protein